MRLALAEAARAWELGEVPVGAVLVSAGGEILARAGNRVAGRHDPTAHAEILAIRAAARKIGNERLTGSILAVTLEPCLMCAAAILQARLAGIVFGAADQREGAIISRADFIAITGPAREIWHLGGILSAECAAILRNFFRDRRPAPSGGPGNEPEFFG